MSSPNRDQRDADTAIRSMILELIEVMFVPVRIVEDVTTRDVSCEAGYSCMPCDLTFTSSTSLRRHIRCFHEDYVYRCTICSARYTRLSTLMNHMERVHVTVSVVRR